MHALEGMSEIAVGGVSPGDDADLEDSDGEEFLCGAAGCGKSFVTLRAVLAHRAGAHGVSKNAEFKQRILGAICPVCAKDFEVRLRCLHHVVHCSKRCRARLLDGGFPAFSAEQLAAADASDLEHRRMCRALGRHELHALVPQ